MLKVATHHAKKALSLPQYYGRGLAKVFFNDPVPLWAQAIAFKTLVTLLPLLLLATGIFGLILRQADPFTTVSQFLRGFLPPGQSDGIVELVLQLQQASGAITALGAAFFVVTVVTLFSTLRYVVGSSMGESRHQMRPIVGGWLFDVRMVLQVGSLFLLSFAMTASARFLSARSGELAAEAGLDAALVTQATGGLLQLVTLVVPYVLTVGSLAQLYYFVPRPRIPVRSALAGAASAAVLFELAKNGFTLYATHLADFDRYAQPGEGLGGLGGAFGLILAFVFWVYFSGYILVTGAVVAALHERRHRPRKSRLRHIWAQKAGAFRRHRERLEAEAAATVEAPADGPASDALAADGGDGAPGPEASSEASSEAPADGEDPAASAPGGDGDVHDERPVPSASS